MDKTNPYGLTDKQMDEIRKGNVLGGRVVDGKFYADWDFDIDITEALKFISDSEFNEKGDKSV